MKSNYYDLLNTLTKGMMNTWWIIKIFEILNQQVYAVNLTRNLNIFNLNRSWLLLQLTDRWKYRGNFFCRGFHYTGMPIRRTDNIFYKKTHSLLRVGNWKSGEKQTTQKCFSMHFAEEKMLWNSRGDMKSYVDLSWIERCLHECLDTYSTC